MIALLVRVIHRVADLAGVVERAAEIERAVALDHRFERVARHVLHHDEEHVVLLLGGEDGDDVRVAQRGEQARLAQQLTEVEILPMGNLDRDFLVDPRVFRQIDAAEAAAAEGREDAVFPDRLSAKEHLCR